MITDRCPVCWRPIPITDHWRMRRHHDKAGHLCPMSGQDVNGLDLNPTEPLSRTEAANHGS